MSLHKLTAGDGYTYLTRQVAAHDATTRGYDGLGDYYSQKGESPGVWGGRGLDTLPEFRNPGPVTEAQMKALFGEGRHPDADRLQQQLITAGRSPEQAEVMTRLGSPFRVFTDVPEFRKTLAERFEAANVAAGLPRDWPLPADERARIRTEVATEMFTAEYGRAPADPRELSGYVARASRQPTSAVAGYDLTFSPVKSVSTLWAVAPPEVAAAIEKAHDAAVADTLSWLENNATYTRTGRNGVQQVEVKGLIAAGFTHRDSRAGDPDLHTHVAISNKVQTRDGRWLALDGRPLHKMTVAASERYNTRLEAHLNASLGVAFADRADTPDGKRPIREIVGVDPHLATGWSSRRQAIDVRRAELSAKFQADHGRTPSVVEALRLAQQATLDTRQAKHEPRSYAEQRAEWASQAAEILGGGEHVHRMIAEALSPNTANTMRERTDDEWVARTAEQVTATVSATRATWQEPHIRAEAERLARSARVPLAELDLTVDAVVAAALSPAVAVRLGVDEPVTEPAALRRTDGASVYCVARAQLYTSAAVVAAEEQLVALAQQTGGRVVSAVVVDMALLESTANGVELNPGQVHLVRELATSGAPLQLAMAPAGTGKTTAMRVLSRAWSSNGGDVLGLAPSAAAAAVLREELGGHTDTLAKLNDCLTRGTEPDWMRAIGPKTLVVVDEAGMAGTPELARAVTFIVSRGASVRLIGDDQQLAAIGAGGVLRDIAETAGAVTLSQVMRFTDPAEGAASLALRSGDTAAIGFYLDNQRVHVGDLTTATDQAYTAWTADRANGLDAVMLAPTRDLVSGLNNRARADRLERDGVTGPQVPLADGSSASAGDTIISRSNNRKLAITASDWVKNGDRWTVTNVRPDGALDVIHIGTDRRLVLPADYVAEHVSLGYAATVHTAQGITADVSHVVATGDESRQLMYVAMTRGRGGNHLYLTTAGDGDPHSIITRDALLPPTAADVFGRVLARDGSQTSAATAQRALDDPATRLRDEAARYADSLTVAAETHLGEQAMTGIDAAAETVLPGLTTSPAYPALRAHLALLAIGGSDPETVLRAAVTERELGSAQDPAAVVDWRLQPRTASTGQAPLPWLTAIPQPLADDPEWSRYLDRRHQQVSTFAAHVAARAATWTPNSAPAWAAALLDAPNAQQLLIDVAVWRAAAGVEDDELLITGPPQLRAAEIRAQRTLADRVAAVLGAPDAATTAWAPTANTVDPRVTADPYWPTLAGRLAAADRAGIDIAALVVEAGARGPLPDEHPAAALWWRLSRHLAPAALNATAASTHGTLTPPWTSDVHQLLGAQLATRVVNDPAWPALVAAVTTARAAGWEPAQVLSVAYDLIRDGQGDAPVRGHELATALTWRVAMLTESNQYAYATSHGHPTGPAPQGTVLVVDFDPAFAAEPDLAVDADEPDEMGPDAADDQWLSEIGWVGDDAANDKPTEPVDRAGERIAELNAEALAYFSSHYADSWAAAHLTERLGADLIGDARFTPGYAPAGWTHLTDHLRGHGATDEEILTAGLGALASTGRVIDRFRDRLILPIYNADEQIVGFVGRRHPDLTDNDKAGPKYLNTGDTPLFTKGDQLYGMHENAEALATGAAPVLVEGPLDVIAVTLAGRGDYVGVASLGTALTDNQADTLQPYIGPDKPGVIVATDPDHAGRAAAIRAYWHLVLRGDNPRHAALPVGVDPADLLRTAGPEQLHATLDDAQPLAHTVIDERIARFAPRLQTAEGQVLAVRSAAQAVAPLPTNEWLPYAAYIAERTDMPHGIIAVDIVEAGEQWSDAPRATARRHLEERLTEQTSASSDTTPPKDDPQAAREARWAALAWTIDPRLAADRHWPTLVSALARAAAAGYDVEANLPRLADHLPDEFAGRILHDRLMTECPAARSPRVRRDVPRPAPADQPRSADVPLSNVPTRRTRRPAP